MPKKFDQDFKYRAVRFVQDKIDAEGSSIRADCQAIAPKFGVSWHSARHWYQQARKQGEIVQAEEDLHTEVARLRSELQEVKDTYKLPKTASLDSNRQCKTLSDGAAQAAFGNTKTT